MTGVARAITRATEKLAAVGLSGSLLVRDLATGTELGIHPDIPMPMASLVKLPLAVAVLSAAEAGEVDLASHLTLTADQTVPGPTGLSLFRHPVTLAIEDLLVLALTVSDDTATDALFTLVGPQRVQAQLERLGVHGLTVRHEIAELYRAVARELPAEAIEVIHALVVEAASSERPSPIPQLNPERSNSGTARAFVDLLALVWSESPIPPVVRARVRELMGANVLRHRLWPEFTSPRMRWFSKTGTFLTLRHEVGVIEHASGRTFAVAVLTRSTVPVAAQPAAEAAMGSAARELVDQLLLDVT